MSGNKAFANLTFAVFSVLVLFDSRASSLKEKKLEMNVADADVVIIGRVVETNLDFHSDGMSHKYANVISIDVLKGDAEAEVKFLYKTGISERDPDCCVVGDTYLFLMHRLKSGIYISVNGKFGVRGTKKKSNMEDKE